MPLPREEVTPPVIKMYFVCAAIRSGGGVEISWILMGYKGREFLWIGLKNRIGIFQKELVEPFSQARINKRRSWLNVPMKVF